MADEIWQSKVLRLACKRLEKYEVFLTQEDKDELLILDYHKMLGRLEHVFRATKLIIKGWM